MRFKSFALFVLAVSMPVAVVAQTAPQSSQSAPQAAPVTAPSQAAPRGAGPQDPETKARWEKFQAACGADLKTHCAGIERSAEKGRGEMRQCIETNKAKFSATCQSAVNEREAARAARKDAQQPAPTDKPKS